MFVLRPLTVFVLQVVQKFFDYGTPQQKSDLADTMRGFMLPLSLDPYGCRSVQKVNPIWYFLFFERCIDPLFFFFVSFVGSGPHFRRSDGFVGV